MQKHYRLPHIHCKLCHTIGHTHSVRVCHISYLTLLCAVSLVLCVAADGRSQNMQQSAMFSSMYIHTVYAQDQIYK